MKEEPNFAPSCRRSATLTGIMRRKAGSFMRVCGVIQKQGTPGFTAMATRALSHIAVSLNRGGRIRLLTFSVSSKMAKTKWPKLPRFFVPLFHCANVYLCRSREEWDAACIHLGVEAGGTETLVGCCQQYQNIQTNENIYLIGVFNGESATLVHECAHATFYCCHDVGVTIDTGSANETYCYLLDRMFTAFLPHIKQD